MKSHRRCLPPLIAASITPLATAAALVVAAVEPILPAGELAPESIHTPGCFVAYLVEAPLRPERLSISASLGTSARKVAPARAALARRTLAELRPGDMVNLGIGIPTLIADLLGPDHDILLHTEGDGTPKLVERCTLPLTTVGAVDRVITALAVFAFERGQPRLVEAMLGATFDEIRARSAAPLAAAVHG